MEIWIVAAVVAGIVLAVVIFALTRGKKKEQALPPSVVTPAPVAAVPEKKVEAKPAPVSKGLTKTRSALKERLEKFWGGTSIPDAEWESLEESLIAADVGVATTRSLIEKVKGRQAEGKPLKDLMREECMGLFHPGSLSPFTIPDGIKPYVISIVGINGVGKTTTIGKLAHHFSSQGKTVLLGAGDTFRAAAISQLKVWAERTGAQFVSGREGADPGAVAFDSVTAAKARGLDIALLDTAGRLHTKSNLMDELKKIHRVIKKVIPEAPHETWLVIDGTLGQNSVLQAKEFQKTLELTGIIVTKLDGTAKGGAILAVSQELGLPVRYIGVGESVEDFVAFNPKEYLEAILG